MNNLAFINQLKAAIQDTQNLPGIPAQMKMANVHRQVKLKSYKIPKNAKIAATLNLLYPIDGVWHTTLTKRVPFDPTKDKHSGQISFPGGRYEEEDATLMHTAIRETEEEIGVAANTIEVLGKMTNLYIPVSNFLVHPYVGFLRERPVFNPSPDEVAQIIETPITTLLNKKNHQETNLTLPTGHQLLNVPYYNVSGHIVWGATAMMLSEFLTLIEQLPYSF